MADIIHVTLADAETSLRKWLEDMTGLVAIQPGNQGALKEQHIMFAMIDLTTQENICEGFDYDELRDQYQQCTMSESSVTYQVDIQNCNTGPDNMIKILKGFKGGLHTKIESVLNFDYSDNSIVRSIPFIRNSVQHYKYTVDITFLFRCKECIDIDAIETVNIAACPGFPNTFIEELTISKP